MISAHFVSWRISCRLALMISAVWLTKISIAEAQILPPKSSPCCDAFRSDLTVYDAVRQRTRRRLLRPRQRSATASNIGSNKRTEANCLQAHDALHATISYQCAQYVNYWTEKTAAEKHLEDRATPTSRPPGSEGRHRRAAGSKQHLPQALQSAVSHRESEGRSSCRAQDCAHPGAMAGSWGGSRGKRHRDTGRQGAGCSSKGRTHLRVELAEATTSLVDAS